VTLTVEPARSATFDLVERARAAGCRVAFDPNCRPALWPDDADRTGVLDRMLTLADLVKASREDVEPFDLPEGEGLAEALLDRGPDTALLTAGSAGATAVATPDAPWGAGEWHHPGHDADVVDATGAGDAFLAGALAALVDGEGPAETLAFANAVAAVATTAEGAMTALPDEDAVERFRERQS